MKNDNCDICGKELSDVEMLNRQHTDFHKVCEEHDVFRKYPLKAFGMLESGMIDKAEFLRLPELQNCCVCKIHLSVKQIESITPFSLNVTCEKHRDVAQWYQVEWAHLWFIFKQVHPSANSEDRDWIYKFNLWRQEQ